MHRVDDRAVSAATDSRIRRAIAIYHPASDRDPRTSPQAVARATLRDRPGRRLRRTGGDAPRAPRRRRTPPHRRPRLRPLLRPPRPSAPAHRGACAAAPPPRQSSPTRRTSQAAKQRKKIPFWAMATLSLMPVWGFIYVRAVTDGARGRRRATRRRRRGLLQLCGLPRRRRWRRRRVSVLRGPVVLQTFPHIDDQIRYVYYGTEGLQRCRHRHLRQP